MNQLLQTIIKELLIPSGFFWKRATAWDADLYGHRKILVSRIGLRTDQIYIYHFDSTKDRQHIHIADPELLNKIQKLIL